MNILAILCAVGLTTLAVVNIVITAIVNRRLRAPARPLLTDEQAPLGLVVMCLRGGDPFLERSLRSLFTQDYPNYRVRIVLDSPNDPARQYVETVLREIPSANANVEVTWLEERFTTCTYKMSGLLSGTRVLPEGTRFVALMDGDTVPHSSWLRELASPLILDHALCSTGTRWYSPVDESIGSMARACWGPGALMMMVLNRIPWGGTMAVRHEVITDERLRRRLQLAFSEDTTIGQFVHEVGGRVVFDPRLVIVNEESTNLRSFFNFDTRQMLAVKLHHRGWQPILFNGLSILPVVLYPLARMCGFPGNSWADTAWIACLSSYVLQALLLTPAIKQIIGRRGESITPWTLPRVGSVILGAGIASLSHVLALWRVGRMQLVVWRGVHYRLGTDPVLSVIHDDSAPVLPPATLAKSA